MPAETVAPRNSDTRKVQALYNPLVILHPTKVSASEDQLVNVCPRKVAPVGGNIDVSKVNFSDGAGRFAHDGMGPGSFACSSAAMEGISGFEVRPLGGAWVD